MRVDVVHPGLDRGRVDEHSESRVWLTGAVPRPSSFLGPLRSKASWTVDMDNDRPTENNLHHPITIDSFQD
jgi:hypothetical protein